MGPGNALPAQRLAAITQPTLVLTGGNSPAWMTSAGQAVAGAIHGAAHRVLAGQTHNVSAEALAPELLESRPEQRRSLRRTTGPPPDRRAGDRPAKGAVVSFAASADTASSVILGGRHGE